MSTPDPLIDRDFLKRLTEAPAVGTACGPVVELLTERFGSGYGRTLVADGFCLFQPGGAAPERLRAVFVAHMDEIGGCVYGERADQAGTFDCRYWGTSDPSLYVGAALQGMDYLAATAGESYTVAARIVPGVSGDGQPERRLAVRSADGGPPLRPYRTVFTFRQETEFDGDLIHGKAVDPRVTLYAVVEAVRRLNDPSVGAVIVMAEECAMDVARKAVAYLQRHAPDLALVVNADVPDIVNLGDARLDLPAIRVFEGRNFIDPSFGIRVAQMLMDSGVALHLSAARSGSQTALFTPLAPTLSVALPGESIHTPRGAMSLTGAARCVDLLTAIGQRFLAGRLG